MESKTLDFESEVKRFHYDEARVILRDLDNIRWRYQNVPVRILLFPDQFEFLYTFNLLRRPVIHEDEWDDLLIKRTTLKEAKLTFRDQATFFMKRAALLENVENVRLICRIKGRKRILSSQKVPIESTYTVMRKIEDLITTKSQKKIKFMVLPEDRRNEIIVMGSQEAGSMSFKCTLEHIPYNLLVPQFPVVTDRFTDLDHF